MTSRTITSASYRRSQLGGDACEQQPVFVPDFGSDIQSVIAGINLLQPTTKYRATTLGKTLIDTLNELITADKISATLVEKALRQFDRSILNAVSEKLAARLQFRARKLDTYRYLDNQWIFILKEVEFREYNFLARAPILKVLAIEGRIPGILNPTGTKRRWQAGEQRELGTGRDA